MNAALAPGVVTVTLAAGRRTAKHWKAIARLVEPLDAARATLHHDDILARRAGAQAAAIVLQHCADTGRSSTVPD